MGGHGDGAKQGVPEKAEGGEGGGDTGRPSVSDEDASVTELTITENNNYWNNNNRVVDGAFSRPLIAYVSLVGVSADGQLPAKLAYVHLQL